MSTGALLPTGGGEGANSDCWTTDRVTLEIKSAKLNVAIQNALRRGRSGEKLAAQGHDEASNRIDEGGLADTKCGGNAAGGGRHGSVSNSFGGGTVGRDAGSVKEAALLKAAVESLRAGLREKEDAVTELEREKEGFLEQTARLASVTQESVNLEEKVAALEAKNEKLEGKLAQAEAGRALTMKLVDTLKSAQNDLRAAHGQVAQRCAELENMAEDSGEAIRRGDSLLHSQQLKIDAQSRQLKRQEEDLATQRNERELQLAKADQTAAELSQVLRRERAGQGRILDAQAEAEELKEELEHMREAFARHRSVMSKNQDVIDAHEKALQDVRSELLSLSLEAEKQSTRHQQAFADAATETARAMGEKDAALRDVRALRLERQDLKDQLEEAGRKRSEEASAAAAVEARASSTKTFGRHRETQNTASPKVKLFVAPAVTPTRQPPSQERPETPRGGFPPHRASSNANHPRPSFRLASDSGNPHERDNFLSSCRFAAPTLSTDHPADEKNSSTSGRSSSSSGRGSKSMSPRPVRTAARSDQPASPATSAADAGGGAGSVVGNSGEGVCNEGSTPNPGDGGGDGKGLGSPPLPLPAGGEDFKGLNGIDSCSGRRQGASSVDARKETSGRRSRPRPPDDLAGERNSRNGSVNSSTREVGGEVAVESAFSEATRKRARKQDGSDEGRERFRAGLGGGDGAGAGAGAGAATSHQQQAMGGVRVVPVESPRGEGVSVSALSDKSVGCVGGLLGSGSSDVLGVCPSCGDAPYGLMINCSSCSRQHHSSCVPEGRRVGKGLGAVFHCIKCGGGGGGDREAVTG